MKSIKYSVIALLLASTSAFAVQGTYISPVITFTNGYGQPLQFIIQFTDPDHTDTLPGLPSSNFVLPPNQSVSTVVLKPKAKGNTSTWDTPTANIRVVAFKPTGSHTKGQQTPFASLGAGLQAGAPNHAEVSGRQDQGISYHWHNHTSHINVAFCKTGYFCKYS